MTCRCGRATATVHPCHWDGYTCPRAGTERFYYVGPAYVAGVNPKIAAASTVACDEHWTAFTKAAGR